MEYYLTSARLEELKKKLEDLKTRARIEVADRLKKAKELGDLSENSEYTEAKEQQEQLERKILELEQTVKNAVLIQKPTSSTGIIQIGSTFRAEKNGASIEFTIVGSTEANPSKGLISNESPLGKAFLGRRAGEVIKIEVPAGEVTYKILKVE